MDQIWGLVALWLGLCILAAGLLAAIYRLTHVSLDVLLNPPDYSDTGYSIRRVIVRRYIASDIMSRPAFVGLLLIFVGGGIASYLLTVTHMHHAAVASLERHVTTAAENAMRLTITTGGSGIAVIISCAALFIAAWTLVGVRRQAKAQEASVRLQILDRRRRTS